MSRISAMTDEIARTPAEAIAFARKYGLVWLELREIPGGRGDYCTGLSPAALREAAAEFRDNGIRISYLDAPLYKIRLPGTEPVDIFHETPEQQRRRAERELARFERRLDEMRRALDAAHILGCEKLRVFGFRRVVEPLKLLPRVADVLGPLVEVAGKEKVRLLIENEDSCNVATCAELAEIARLIPSKWFGINFDTLNGAELEQPFPHGYSLLPKKRIGNFHIKGRSVLPGPQRLDWAAFFRAATADGYRECFGLETHMFGEGDNIQSSHDSMREIVRILTEV